MVATPPVLSVAELGPATLVRKYVCFVDTKTTGTDPVWTQLMGTTSFKPTTSANVADTTSRDNGGDATKIKTGREWGFEIGVMRKTQSATVLTAYDPAQEFLRMKAEEIGLANLAHVMVFEDNGSTGPKVEAYEGMVVVEYDVDSDGIDDPSDATITLSGTGKRKLVTHPLAS